MESSLNFDCVLAKFIILKLLSQISQEMKTNAARHPSHTINIRSPQNSVHDSIFYQALRVANNSSDWPKFKLQILFTDE